MLWSPELAVVPVTIHLPLAEVAAALDDRPHRRDRTDHRARSASRVSASPGRASRSPGSIPMPARTAPWGGRRIEIIGPPWQRSKPRASRRAARSLPTPCSTPRRARRYDAALCMYHDQALIPIKTLDFDDGVNVTLGLPFVRTSPDHGTAFDIAGTGPRRPGEPDRRDPAGRRGSQRARAARRRMTRAGRPAAAARGDRAARPVGQEVARARTSSSTST